MKARPALIGRAGFLLGARMSKGLNGSAEILIGAKVPHLRTLTIIFSLLVSHSKALPLFIPCHMPQREDAGKLYGADCGFSMPVSYFCPA